MARDGSTGTYTRAVPPYVFDTIIDENAVNSEFDDIAAALTQSVSKDGQTTMTGNLKMGGYKLTNAGDASAQNEYTTAAQVQKGTANYLLSIGGTADAITAIASFSMAAYTAGQQFIFVPTANNTSTTPTININAIGALTIKRDASVALVANDIVSGRPAKLYYNGTDMILLNPATVAASQLQGGTVTVPVVFERNSDDTLVIRDTRNTDDTVVSPIRLEGGDGSGNDITVRAVLDGANGLKRYDINFASGGSTFLFNRDGRLTLGADGSGSTDAVTKQQMDAGPHVAAGYSNIRVSRTGNASIDIDASHITVFDSSGNGRGLRNVDLSVAITTGGVNGLDTGSEASDTWYYGYVIYNPTTNTVAGLLSASPTAPTLPSGYTFARLVTAVRNNASSNFIDYIQRNERVQYRGGTPPEISSGAVGTVGSAWGAAISIASMVPTAVAGEIDVQAWATASNSRIVMAPNNSYDADPVGVNAPPIGGGGTSGAANFTGNIACGTLLLESDNVYVASNANTKSACRGFRIAL